MSLSILRQYVLHRVSSLFILALGSTENEIYSREAKNCIEDCVGYELSAICKDHIPADNASSGAPVVAG